MNSATADSPLWIRDLAQETVYIVQSSRAGRATRLLADRPLACKSELTARRTAEHLAQSRVGVIAWSRTGDAELGDFDEKPIVEASGKVLRGYAPNDHSRLV